MSTTWRLKWTSDEGIPDLSFGKGVHLLGSSADVDLHIADPTVSRKHARLTVTDEGVTVEDLGSTNGTVVNGERLEDPMLVNERVSLKCGKVSFVLERAGQSTQIPKKQPDADLSSDQSVLLGSATVGFLRDQGKEVAFPAGEIIVRRGEKQDSFYVVIDGVVELLVTEGESRGRPLARLDAGGIFGAESVLAKEGAAVDAVAVTDVHLLKYPASALPTALQESASLRRKMMRGIARHLHDAAGDVLDLLHGTEVIARLVQGDSDPDEMFAVSARMKSVAKKIDHCSQKRTPVAIVGEDGTGKTLISRLIHDRSSSASGQVIAVNCRDLAPAHAAELILGKDLGGRLAIDTPGSGGIHLAHGGTLVLRDADALELGAQRLLAAHLWAHKSREPGAYPDTRIIVTARSAAVQDEGRGALVPSLLDCFDDIIKLPPLVDRPKDIMPLAEGFLKRHGPQAPTISDGARQALLSLSYRRRNVAELREVVDLAVRVADGPLIRAEHIFSGVGEDAAIPGLDLTRTPMVRRLLRPMGLPLVRVATLVSFVAVIGLCLAVPWSWLGRISNTFIWSAWEPVVFGLFFLAGPVWCTICPLSTAARAAKKAGGLEKPPAPWVLRQGPWLSIVGFALIVWSERVFNSSENPVASGILLACLIGAAVIFALLYKREVWCRHLCPLGRLATTLAPAAPLQLTARQQVCASSCSTHDCYKGAQNIPGCTVFHHPLEGKSAYRCKMCLDCLQSCPHRSARLQIRSPLIAVWNVDTNAKDLAMFAIAVSLLALGFVAAHAVPALATPLGLTAMCGTAIVVGVALHHLILRLASTDERKTTAIRAALAMMILGWAALMTGQLANIPVIAKAHVGFASGLQLPHWLPEEISLLTILQVLVILVGTVLALFTLDQIPRYRSSRAARVGWLLAPVAFLGYAAAVVFLLLV